jgi:large subunit ribosomal protein L18
MKLTTADRRERRMVRVRRRIIGTATRPRLAVFRSNKHIGAQLIDDTTNRTMAAAFDTGLATGTKMERARGVGKKIATLAKKKKIGRIVFDRRHYRFHGRVAAVAQGAREEGLEF